MSAPFDIDVVEDKAGSELNNLSFLLITSEVSLRKNSFARIEVTSLCGIVKDKIFRIPSAYELSAPCSGVADQALLVGRDQ